MAKRMSPRREENDSAFENVPQDDAAIGRALRRSLQLLVLLVIVLVMIVGLFWLQRDERKSVVVEPVPPSARDLSETAVPPLPFADITTASGIRFVHENGVTEEKLLPETMGGGVAFFDFDNDSDADLFFVNSKRWPWVTPQENKSPAHCTLYANDGHGNFTDVTEEAGLKVEIYGMGVAAGDYDNDGWTDLLITAVGRNRLLKNRAGKFSDVTEQANVGGEADSWSTSAAWFDYDNDGRLDLFVCNYVQWSREIDLSQAFTLKGGGRAYGPPRAFGGSYPYLYHNEGEGKFRDVSQSSGVQITNQNTGVPLGKGMGVAPVDVDQDGFLDLVVANDTVQNFLLMNQEGKQFAELAELSGIAYDRSGVARGAMGVDTAIFRPDGTLAIGIGNFANEMSALYVAQPKRTQFFDAALATGFGPPTRLALTFGLFFFDADLDSRLDIFGANGHLEQEISKVQNSMTYEQPPQLFWNAGSGGTTELVQVSDASTGKDFSKPMVGRGAAYADIDGDGDLDIAIAGNGSPARLLQNNQTLGHHWVRLKLVGSTSNRDAIGAVVRLTSEGTNQVRMVMPTRSYCSQCELPITFGLGSHDSVESCTIRWPSGKQQTVNDLAIDRLTEIKEPE
jgi:enediyne biosynthesis protein E4